MTPGFDQLAAWREATGRQAPGDPVPLQVRAIVGNLTLTMTGEKLPPAAVGMVKALAAGKRRKVKPKRGPAPAMLASLHSLCGDSSFRDRGFSGQRIAYQQAIRTGEWAPVPAAA